LAQTVHLVAASALDFPMGHIEQFSEGGTVLVVPSGQATVRSQPWPSMHVWLMRNPGEILASDEPLAWTMYPFVRFLQPDSADLS